MRTTNTTPKRVRAPVLGEEPVEATVEGYFVEATIIHGPRRVFRVDVDGSTYRVPETSCTPI